MKKDKKIGVGIIGASLTSWAATAHIPALRLIPQFDLVAISTTNMSSAEDSAKKNGVKYAYDNEFDLVNCPEVELVIVAVKVPHHFQLVKAAIDAGKMVYCEWPLGNGTSEAERLVNLSKNKNIRTFVGLQALSLPEVHFLKQFIANGAIGEVYSSSIIGSGGVWGAIVPDESYLYLNDPSNGATMLDIPFSHTLAAFMDILSPFETMSSLLTNRRQKALLLTNNEKVDLKVDDQIVVSGILECGVVANIHYRGGMSAGLNLYWEIKGEKGDIIITGDLGQFQLTPIKIQYALNGEVLEELKIPASFYDEIDVPGQPIHGLYYAYKAVLDDILNGTKHVPNFDSALNMHKLLDRIKELSICK